MPEKSHLQSPNSAPTGAQPFHKANMLPMTPAALQRKELHDAIHKKKDAEMASLYGAGIPSKVPTIPRKLSIFGNSQPASVQAKMDVGASAGLVPDVQNAAIAPALDGESDSQGEKSSLETAGIDVGSQTSLGLTKDVVVNAPQGGVVLRNATTITVSYSVPIEKTNIQASASETLIFGIVAADSAPGADVFETKYSLTGLGEFNSAGSGLTSVTRPGIISRNVNVVTGATFTKDSITVTGVIRNTTQNRDEVTITWTIIPRTAVAPQSLKKVTGPSATAWSATPADYVYKAGPDIGADGKADYVGQTVLERFGTVSALGFTMDDLTDVWKAANPTINTPDKVASFIWNSGGNGTFVFNSQDLIGDRHDGFGAEAPFKPTAFDDADGIGYRLPQEYVVGTTVIGKCNIDRRKTKASGIQIQKSDPIL